MKHFPFEIKRVYQGFGRTEGVAHFKKDTITLEFETRDNIVGVISSGLKTVDIDLREISSIQVKRGISNLRVILSSKKMSTFNNIPGHLGTELVLWFSAKHKDDILLLESQIKVRLTEYELEEDG